MDLRGETLRHDLFDELDAFDPKWQTRYLRLAEAAAAAGCTQLYQDWLRTEHGEHYRRRIASAHNHIADNEARRAQREAEAAMVARGRRAEARGYLTEEDEV